MRGGLHAGRSIHARVWRMTRFLPVDHNYHNNTDLAIGPGQGRAVYPARFAFDDVVGRSCTRIVGEVGHFETCRRPTDACQPGDFCSNTDALSEGFDERVAHVLWAADVVFELRLAEPWDAERRGGEDYPERRGRAHEDVLGRSAMCVARGRECTFWYTPRTWPE